MKKRIFSVRFPVLLLFAVMILTDRSGLVFLTLLAAAGHECGHLLAAKCLHIPLRQMSLDLLGARIEVNGRMLSYGEEWLLAAAGPFASLLLSLLAAPFWHYRSAFAFSAISLLLGLLNLLPIRTFDGGRMLETALTHYTSPRCARYVMRLVSFFCLFLLWAIAVYELIRIGDGLSLFCFSMSLFARLFDGETER